MSIGYDKFYPKPFLPVKPQTEHPPSFEPVKMIQPVDPFHNAFYYTNDHQNNIVSQNFQPEVVIPMMYRRRRRHDFVPVEPIPKDTPPQEIYGSRISHVDNTAASNFVSQPSTQPNYNKATLMPFSML